MNICFDMDMWYRKHNLGKGESPLLGPEIGQTSQTGLLASTVDYELQVDLCKKLKFPVHVTTTQYLQGRCDWLNWRFLGGLHRGGEGAEPGASWCQKGSGKARPLMEGRCWPLTVQCVHSTWHHRCRKKEGHHGGSRESLEMALDQEEQSADQC